MKKTAITILLILFGLSSYANENSPNHSKTRYVGIDAGGDYMLNALNIYGELLDSYAYWHTGISYGERRLPSGDYFDYAYNYPEYGLRAFFTRSSGLKFKNNSSLGDLYTVQGFFKPNFYRNNTFSIGPVINLGLTYTPKKWDPKYNTHNFYVGTHVLVNLGAGIEARVQCSKHLSLALQAVISHRSNGMMRVPNFGINNVEASLQLRYDIDQIPAFTREKRPEIDYKKFYYDIYATGGVHACDAERNIIEQTTGKLVLVKSYARLNIGALAAYRYHPIFATGIGLDLFYTGNWKRLEECSRMLGKDDKCYPVFVGAYIQQSIFYKKLELGIGLGLYLFKELGPEDSGIGYQRVSLKYHIEKPGIVAGVAFRAHKFDRSDTIELVIGKRF